MDSKLPLSIIRFLFDTTEPGRIQEKFLDTIVLLPGIVRASLWVRRKNRFVCTAAKGKSALKILGAELDIDKVDFLNSMLHTETRSIVKAGECARHIVSVDEIADPERSLGLFFPMKTRDEGSFNGILAVLDVSAGGEPGNLDPGRLESLEALVEAGKIALDASFAMEENRKQAREMKRILEKVRATPAIIGKSRDFVAALEKCETYARTDFPVMITGESGTGKDIVANQIHLLSARRDRPFLVQNCSAIPDTLLESELFGHRKGSFTGAMSDKDGLFVAADGGTVFLDEIGDMPLALQAKILHVLQNSQVKPVGSEHFRPVNVRIISATNRDLRKYIDTGHFREDLYFRLNVLPLNLPPLRDRGEDILLLFDYLLRRFAPWPHQKGMKLSPDAREWLMKYKWPGNVREMENLVKHLVTVHPVDSITMSDLTALSERTRSGPRAIPREPAMPAPATVGEPREPASLCGYTWDGLEREYILSLMERMKWNIASASRQAGVKRSTFCARMKRLGISKKQGVA